MYVVYLDPASDFCILGYCEFCGPIFDMAKFPGIAMNDQPSLLHIDQH